MHTQLGNGGIVSLDNVQYDVGSNSALPASGTVGSGTFITDGTGIAAGNPLNGGISNSIYSVQGFAILLPLTFPDSIGAISLLGENTTDGATYAFNGEDTSVQIKMPISIPFTFDFEGILLNGTASGQIVANAIVPEPASIVLIGLGLASLVAMVRRRGRAGECTERVPGTEARDEFR